VALRTMLQTQLLSSLQDSRRPRTLEDWPPSENVETPFALGRWLVYKQWPEMRFSMRRNRWAAPLPPSDISGSGEILAFPAAIYEGTTRVTTPVARTAFVGAIESFDALG